jgi:hypothetical protein
VLARVPAHAGWTNPRIGDPGRTLVELFAWLTDALLYAPTSSPSASAWRFSACSGCRCGRRRPRGLVTWSSTMTRRPRRSRCARARASAVRSFETRAELTVANHRRGALQAAADAGRRPGSQSPAAGSARVYSLKAVSPSRATTAVFAGGVPAPEGFDLIADTVDKNLWLALMAAKRNWSNRSGRSSAAPAGASAC